jgi:hypothetical protein
MCKVLAFNLQFKINFFVEKWKKNSLERIKFSKDHEKDCYREKNSLVQIVLEE